MRKTLIIATAAVVLVAGAAFVLNSTAATGPVSAAQASVSVLELMANAKNLPVAPQVDAF